MFDRMILAAARRRRHYTAQLDTAKPGDFGIGGIMALLMRRNIEGG